MRLAVSSERTVNGSPVDHFYVRRFDVPEMAGRATHLAYAGSRMFESVGADIQDPDLVADVRISSVGDYGYYTAVSRYTLGILPSFSGEIFRVETTISNSSGTVIFHDIREERPVHVRTFPRVSTFTGSLRIDLFSAGRVAERIIYDLNREALYQFYFQEAWDQAVVAKNAHAPVPAAE